MNREELIDQLTEDILAYVMHGGFPERELAHSLKPEELDERFDEYELLLDLHFILKPDVVRFVEQLPKRLRSIRTETETVARTQRGTVDGHKRGLISSCRLHPCPQTGGLSPCYRCNVGAIV